jgi:hypothetical protein
MRVARIVWLDFLRVLLSPASHHSNEIDVAWISSGNVSLFFLSALFLALTTEIENQVW